MIGFIAEWTCIVAAVALILRGLTTWGEGSTFEAPVISALGIILLAQSHIIGMMREARRTAPPDSPTKQAIRNKAIAVKEIGDE